MFTDRIAAPLGLACAIGLIGACSLAKAADDQVERGKYLVEEVAKCGDCHTPFQNGQPDRSKWLKGATLPFAPTVEVPNWHKTAPDLTPEGRIFQRRGEKGLVTFLTTGKGPRGNAADPPDAGLQLEAGRR